MNKKLLKTMLKPLLPKLGNWLHGIELLEGEKQAVIMLDIVNDNLVIKIVALAIIDGKLEIVRVIETMDGENLI